MSRCARREPSLESLALQLNLPVHTPHHALGDALTTAQVLIVLASRLGTGAPITARTLVRLSRDQQ
jgi:DNA polymerase-3 subunit epsilon